MNTSTSGQMAWVRADGNASDRDTSLWVRVTGENWKPYRGHTVFRTVKVSKPKNFGGASDGYFEFLALLKAGFNPESKVFQSPEELPGPVMQEPRAEAA